MDDDDDYMSEALLAQLSAAEEAGNAGASSRKRKRVAEKPNAQPSRKALENERREEGLTTPVSEDTKGFKMLKLMGYKPGSGLGKTAQGIVEPLPIEVRDHKSGLGVFEQQKEELARKKEAEAQVGVPFSSEKRAKIEQEYLSKTRSHFADRRVLSDIRACLAAIETFQENGARQNPSSSDGSNANEQPRLLSEIAALKTRKEVPPPMLFVERELQPSQRAERLLELITYLRTKYSYCIYCGAQFSSNEELRLECPGPLLDDHD